MKTAEIQGSITQTVESYKEDLIQERRDLQGEIQTLKNKRDVAKKRKARMENRCTAIDCELRKLNRCKNVRFL